MAKATIAGRFLPAHPWRAKPFAEIGQRVAAGEIVGLVQVGCLYVPVTAPADAVQRWSTDPRSRVPALPPLGPDDELPTCLQTVHRGELIHG